MFATVHSPLNNIFEIYKNIKYFENIKKKKNEGEKEKRTKHQQQA